MKTIAILDLETSTANPATAGILEVALLRWDVRWRTRTLGFSSLVYAEENPAFEVNRIPVEALREAPPLEWVLKEVGRFITRVDGLAAHNGLDFDRPILVRAGCSWVDSRVWVDTMTDLEYPRASSSQSLLAIAHAHGVQIGPLHRAGDDVVCVATLLERCAELGVDVQRMIERGMRPKARFVADAPRSMNDVLKEHRFRWDPERREWWRRMPIEDARELPFAVREAS